MGITFAYELGLKSFFIWKIIYSKNPQKPNRTKDTGLLRTRGGKFEKKIQT